MDINKVLTERGTRYGSFKDHAIVAQTLKSVVAQFLYQNKKQLDADMREALDMICHKMARIINGDHTYIDSWTDIAGYATLVAKRLQETRSEPTQLKLV
jgi:hypothetical protein